MKSLKFLAMLCFVSLFSNAQEMGYTPINVDITKDVVYHGKKALKVEITKSVQDAMLNNEIGGNGITLAVIDNSEFSQGVIELDIAGEVNHKGSADARGFVGVAFHIQPEATQYEAIYLRMTNGTLNTPIPPEPRNLRAIQYIAHPNFHFDVSRKDAPMVFEKAAPVKPKQWFHYKLEITQDRAQAYIDGVLVLDVPLKLEKHSGKIGLFVDDGSAGYFANIRITSRK